MFTLILKDVKITILIFPANYFDPDFQHSGNLEQVKTM
jgi:hypothetical protein